LQRLLSNFLAKHDLFRKPVSTFPDHALRLPAAFICAQQDVKTQRSNS
jgi:hypothetical protein